MKKNTYVTPSILTVMIQNEDVLTLTSGVNQSTVSDSLSIGIDLFK